MIPGEEYYLALKKLTEMPEWKDYEAFLGRRLKEMFDKFSTGPLEDIPELHYRAKELRWVQFSVGLLIHEVENSRKT